MEKSKKAEITKEKMIADGWIMSEEKPPIFLFEKSIPNRNPINNTPEDSDIKLVMHGMYNVWRFAVLLPDGGMLNFVANSMTDLKFFENSLDFYDPPY